MCAPTVAANALSAANTTFNVTVLLYTETRHRLRQCIRIHLGSLNPSLVLLLVAELGARSVVRVASGVRLVAIATTSSEKLIVAELRRTHESPLIPTPAARPAT